MIAEKIGCPLCHGMGKIKPPDDVMQGKRLTARALRDRGYSLRKIMRVMNYKSVSPVEYLLKDKSVKNGKEKTNQ